jgi:Xaa-Pro aminopeptidase
MIDPSKSQNIQSHRINQIRKWLVEKGFSSIILFDPVNIRYATQSRNMQVWTMHNLCRYAVVFESGKIVMFELPSAMHLSQNLDSVTELRPAITADYMAVAGRTSEMAARWAREIRELLDQEGVCGEPVAIDRADLELVFAAQAIKLNLVDGKQVMERARSIKSVDEIEALKWSLQTCESSVMDMKNQLEPGMTESQALGMLIRGCIDRGGEYPETRLLSSGPRTNPWFQETSDRIIRNGDMLAFDTDMIGPLGFYNDISRSWIVGDRKPDEMQKFLYNTAHEQLQHNLSLLKPGLGFLEYSDKSYRLPEKCIPNRYADVAHGCGMGVEYPFIWYREDEQWGAYDGVFEENMVVCVECYAGELHGKEGVKLEQPVWIRESGPELLSEFPLEQDYLV